MACVTGLGEMVDAQVRANVPIDWCQLDLPLCVQSGQVFRWTHQGDRWTGIAGGRVFFVQACPGGYAVETHPPDPELAAFSGLFRLEVDLPSLQTELIRIDERWQPMIDALPGMRLLRWNRVEECLFSFLCTPANNIPRITGMIERLCARYGEVILERDGVVYKGFPPAVVIAGLQEPDLSALGFGFRGRTLIQAARALLEREDGWLESLKMFGYWEAKKELMSLPGVGAKVADCVLLLGVDKVEAVPVDTHLWQAIQWFMPELQGQSLTDRTYRMIIDWFHTRFGGLTNWAHQYLFTAHLRFGDRLFAEFK